MSAYGKRSYSGRPQGYNKSARMVGGRLLTYRAALPVRGSSRYNRMMMNRRGVSSPETGFVDLAATGYNFSTTGSIALIATIAQGASVNQRVGKKIVLKSLQVRGQSISGTTTTVADCALVIVYDRRPTGSLPAISDVLVSADSTAFNNDANSGRFQILKRVDFCHTGNSTTPATGGEIRDMAMWLSLKDLPVAYKAAGTGAIGDIEQGALYLITVGSNVAGTTAPQGTLAFRTRFLDV